MITYTSAQDAMSSNGAETYWTRCSEFRGQGVMREDVQETVGQRRTLIFMRVHYILSGEFYTVLNLNFN